MSSRANVLELPILSKGLIHENANLLKKLTLLKFIRFCLWISLCKRGSIEVLLSTVGWKIKRWKVLKAQKSNRKFANQATTSTTSMLNVSTRTSMLIAEVNRKKTTHQAQIKNSIHLDPRAIKDTARAIQIIPLNKYDKQLKWLNSLFLLLKSEKPTPKYAMHIKARETETAVVTQFPLCSLTLILVVKPLIKIIKNPKTKNKLRISIRVLWMQGDPRLNASSQILEKIPARHYITTPQFQS